MSTPTEVTIAGQPVTIQQFSAAKAIVAMETIAEVEGTFRKVIAAGAEFRQQYATENFMTMTRVEARRQFGPQPLIERVDAEDGTSIMRPLLDAAGAPVIGPDPLAHITEEDWVGSDQVLRIPEFPSERMVTMAMIPMAFREGKVQMFRLIALVTTPNTDLQAWDEAGEDIPSKLDERAQQLHHQCMAHEPIALFVAAMQIARDQLSDPFDAATTTLSEMFGQDRQDQETERQAPPQEPMTPIDESESPPTSSTPLPDATAGSPASSSTESAGVA